MKPQNQPTVHNSRMASLLAAAGFGIAALSGTACADHTVKPPQAPIAAAPSKPVVIAREAAPANLTTNFAVPVLMYHRVCDLSPREARSPLMRDLTVPPAAFEQQVRYLASNGFTFLLASQVSNAVRNHLPLPAKSVCITMDDGYRDNFEVAFPILQKYHACATIFLVTSTLDSPGHLTQKQIVAMQSNPVGYGSHTVSHPDLTEIPAQQLDFELRASKRILETRLAEPVDEIAYPSGKYNMKVAERAMEAGYLAGWKKGGGPAQPGCNPYLLPRVRVNGQEPMSVFQRTVWSGVALEKMNSKKRTM